MKLETSYICLLDNGKKTHSENFSSVQLIKLTNTYQICNWNTFVQKQYIFLYFGREIFKIFFIKL